MNNSIEKWEDINEGYATAKGRQVLLINGKRVKLVYKAQNDNQLLIKLVRTIGVIDDSGKMTSKGAGALVNFFNSQIGLVNSYGKLDSNFFSKKVIVYTVLKDTPRTEKIQLTLTDRSKIPGLDSKTQFISTAALKQLSVKDQVVKGIVDDTEQKVKVDDTSNDPEEIKSGEAEDAKGTGATMRASGVKFRYEMRSNSTLYSMEFTEDGAIDSVRVKGSGVNGQVSWEDNAPYWYTDVDNTAAGFKKAAKSKDPLAIDGEITNNVDREFFTKIFTDDDFLQEILNEYQEKYAKFDINGDTIRGMLYYPDNSKIFPDYKSDDDGQENQVAASGTESSPSSPEYYGGIHKA
jgi:hypothetical protein